MDARLVLLVIATLSATIQTSYAQGRGQGRLIGAAMARAESPNFIAMAPDPQMAQQVAKRAEQYRDELAVHWLGAKLPQWSTKCPIVVMAGDKLGAGGQTTFTLSGNSVVSWNMQVQGTYERILDSVLPHEITHTVLATHFSRIGQTVPRWADEGACTTVEHIEEKTKNNTMLVEILSTGRGIPFATLFALKEYPPDIMPLYAQGYSLSIFLINQGGAQKFVKFLEEGATTENWVAALDRHYSYPQLGKLQTAWNQWVADGGGDISNYTGVALARANGNVALASAQVPAKASMEQIAGVQSQPAQAPLAGRFAVARNQPNTITEGFEPQSSNDPAAAWQPVPSPVQTASTTAPAARLADNPSAGGNYQFQPIQAESHARSLPQPFQGVGSSPAYFQFGPSGPLTR